MAVISAKEVAELRRKTGIGVMECKRALVEADGDMDKAVTILREKGQLKAQSKIENRIAADGIVDILSEDGRTAMIEVNTETDFVAKNAGFRSFVKGLLTTVLRERPADVDALLAAPYCGGDHTVDAELREQIFKIGEKLSIRRFVVEEGVTSTYIHGGGNIGVIVRFDTDVADKEGFPEFALNIALQIAAYTTPYLCREQVPADVIESEKRIAMAQIANDPASARKPDAVKEKMALGRLTKFYESHCLMDMEYFRGEGETVAAYVKRAERELGGRADIRSFHRFEKGEGIQKREEDFAEEIEKLAGGR